MKLTILDKKIIAKRYEQLLANCDKAIARSDDDWAFDYWTSVKEKLQIPYAVLCELTHRCPLSCPYCSNPVELEMKSKEMKTNEIR